MAVPSLVRPGDTAPRQIRAFVWVAAGLAVCFGPALAQLGRFAMSSEFNSYILLVPAMAAGMVSVRWKEGSQKSEPNRLLAILLLVAGVLALGCLFMLGSGGTMWTTNRLAFATLSFVLLLAGLAAWFLGRQMLASVGFPLGFLVCMTPLPASVTTSLEYLLQHASASLANIGFQMSDLPMFRPSDLEFQVPGITLEVAPECSGIQSTLALFVVSLAAGYLFLRSPWKRAVLTLAVVPLGVLRNAVRIITIGELCVHIGPEMINSYIHRHGGWVFFLATLVPFFVLLYFLVRLDRRRGAAKLKPLEA